MQKKVSSRCSVACRLSVVLVWLVAVFVLVGCEREQAEAVSVVEPAPSPGAEEGEEARHQEAHAHDEGHLGAHMYEIGRRYAAVWYAGKAGNAAMVDYQIHEIEEVIEELRAVRPVEEGVDVVDFFERGVLPGLERLEEAVDAGDQAIFEREYAAVFAQCNACHTATKHGFITVGRPEYNPYPNLKMGPKIGEVH
ncbi:hypothetical protein DL240_10840 [Lujinxingia litoralis]|uniref:Cytochrome c domain-containing protein n=1 Tax=Lujinxingia litoralis TaxID=2211119 RepID=A0A328CAV0_9DELT|nr:hypothetical protein [Lujinxingia litoralis]RAL22337.1 hypothetical protein DL240_10840 [Lujinxingia litoralis]